MKGSCGYFMSRVPNFGLQLITPRSTHIIPTPITIMFILCGRYVQWTIIVHCVSTEELGRVFHHNISKGKNIVSFIKILALYFWFVIVKASKGSVYLYSCANNSVVICTACDRYIAAQHSRSHLVFYYLFTLYSLGSPQTRSVEKFGLLSQPG